LSPRAAPRRRLSVMVIRQKNRKWQDRRDCAGKSPGSGEGRRVADGMRAVAGGVAEQMPEETQHAQRAAVERKFASCRAREGFECANRRFARRSSRAMPVRPPRLRSSAFRLQPSRCCRRRVQTTLQFSTRARQRNARAHMPTVMLSPFTRPRTAVEQAWREWRLPSLFRHRRYMRRCRR